MKRIQILISTRPVDVDIDRIPGFVISVKEQSDGNENVGEAPDACFEEAVEDVFERCLDENHLVQKQLNDYEVEEDNVEESDALI
jgi:hypothetical protein